MRITPIGRIIRAARIATNTTMADMAKWFNMKPSAICAIETGKRPTPPGFLEKAADFFEAQNDKRIGFNIRELIEEAQPDREEPVDVLNVETGETEENKA